jgi:galactose mutarotase-like enzyme
MATATTERSDSPALGELVILTDERAECRVVIAPSRGAIVTSFRVEERELLFMDDATLRDPNKNVRGGIPVLFPSPGKLEGDRFQRAGRSGSMKQHGFARTEAWRVRSLDRDASSVTLELSSNDSTRKQFPWDFSAELMFTLDHTCLRIDFKLQNLDAAALPFAVGFHPYFHVADKAKTHVSTDATQAFDNVAKRVVPFDEFDWSATELDLHLLDHSSPESMLEYSDGSHLAVRASDEFSLWVVWSLRERDFICLEPWTAPGNALNTGDRLIELAPGGTHESFVEFDYTADY